MTKTWLPSQLDHLSHSSREQFLRCAKSWFLSRMTKAPKWPALWSAGGSAVHLVTEEWDREPFPDEGVVKCWNHHFDKQLAAGQLVKPEFHTWRQSKAEPVEVWRVQGLDFVRAYIDWRKRSPWEIWTTPDVQPAIELDVSGRLPGCEIDVWAFVDRIFHDPVFDKLWIFDLKSGKKPPKSADQFGTYAALIEVKYGVRINDAACFLNRKATLGKPYDLTEYTPEFVGQLFGEAHEDIKTGEFPANGYDSECFLCDIQESCHTKGGPLAHLYDPDHPSHPDHVIPF